MKAGASDALADGKRWQNFSSNNDQLLSHTIDVLTVEINLQLASTADTSKLNLIPTITRHVKFLRYLQQPVAAAVVVAHLYNK